MGGILFLVGKKKGVGGRGQLYISMIGEGNFAMGPVRV